MIDSAERSGKTDSESWRKITGLFGAALELAPARRRKFLENACAGDADLRREVERMIEAAENSKDFLESPAVGAVADIIAGQTEKFASGRRFGRYEILRQIGAGGMGEIYLAEDAELQRKVALKFLTSEFSADPDRLRRFRQEAQAASALNHANILTVYEIGRADGLNFIVSEFVEGETLREKLRREKIGIPEAIDIAAQIAAALEAAHRAGVVHRDIKPENVVVRTDGAVKVLDFGLAKLTEKKSIGAEAETQAFVQTQAGMILGTAAYMSPEQARGLPVDARSDIWSLGVVLYEMLTGRTPFAGETTPDLLAAILKSEPAPLARGVREIPTPLAAAAEKCLRKNAGERYQNAGDLLGDLKNLKQDLEIQSRLKLDSATQETQTLEPAAAFSETKNPTRKIRFAVLLLLLLALGGAIGFWLYVNRSANAGQIESIAVMPFVNESGNADVEYLSDGMTETLIGSLSQIPKLNVKARSSVFRYKGKETDAKTVGKELNVQAILNGRVVQRGQDLILYVELVDAATENSLWKQTYNKTLTNLVSLQTDIARDVADKLRVKLSGADERKLTKNYTQNTEAYQLYLRGRYHVYKLTPPEVQKGISYFQRAIGIDPNYALAYAGLSDAYRSLAVGGEMLPTEFLPKAKQAAQKAIEIDDTLSEAHTTFGINMFWYDRDWSAAENQFKRALELNPNNANAHIFYAHLLSNLGRHAESLAETKRAKELDPLSPFVNALEGQFLNHAGRTDEALVSLQKTFELEPNFWLAHVFASSAYIKKGMYTEAISEARTARALSPAQTVSVSLGGYALAKSGKSDEARASIEELLQLSNARFVPPTHIALVYNGLGETDKALEWLEKGYEQRDPKMTFLKVEPKWNNLRGDARFQDLLRRVGLPQ